jgi:hypothetical protein
VPAATESALAAFAAGQAIRSVLARRERTTADGAPDSWPDWLGRYFPRQTRHPFSAHHAELWDWVWSIQAGRRPPPFVQILARGGGKSSSAELACAALGARSTRRYGWYVSETQTQADDHVQNVATLLESDAFATGYPRLSERRVGKFGNQRAWRRNRLWTASGYVLDALGLDTAARGVKLEEARPDLMIFDDLDRQSDGPAIVETKIRALTRAILPAGADDLAVLAIQNLIHDQGIFARLAGLADERADFLADRIVSGPHPALLDACYEQTADGRHLIVSGTPTWDGQDVAACQRMIDTYGLSSFRVECQHEVDTFEGGLFSSIAFRHCRPEDVPDLVRCSVWVDPAVTETDKSDSHGIQADGIAADRTVYRLRSWEGITSPRASLRRALLCAIELGARVVGVETDQGGDTWRSVYAEAWRSLVDDASVPKDASCPSFASAKAGAGHGPKVERAHRMLADYERGNVVHVLGDHAVLERALRRFPIREPHDLTDAAYWAWYDLRGRHLRGVVGSAVSDGWSPGQGVPPPPPNPGGIEHYRKDGRYVGAAPTPAAGWRW